jgi:hypothetical protein
MRDGVKIATFYLHTPVVSRCNWMVLYYDFVFLYIEKQVTLIFKKLFYFKIAQMGTITWNRT